MMFMITYNPMNPESNEENTQNIDTAIKAISNGGKSGGFFQNFWLAQTQLNAPNIRDLLRPHMNPGDRLFVARIAQNWAGLNMGEKFPEWLSSRQFGTFGNIVPRPAGEQTEAPAES